MHDAALMRDVARRLDALAAETGRRIVRVEVRLGALSHMTPDHFRDHFKALPRGGSAEGAELVVEQCRDVLAPDAASVRILRVAVDDAD